jgi:LPS-assembly lipoprotein
LSLLVAACGFRLQGAIEVPESLARIHVAADDPYSPLVRELARALDGTTARLVSEPAGANAVLRIRQDSVEQRVLSVSAQGQPREYEVVYTVRYEIALADGRRLEPQQIELRRDYPFDETDVLGRVRESQFLIESMRSDMAAMIVRRLAATGAR